MGSNRTSQICRSLPSKPDLIHAFMERPGRGVKYPMRLSWLDEHLTDIPCFDDEADAKSTRLKR